MKRFRFSLQSVAMIRSHAESRAREALATALKTQADAEATCENWKTRLVQFEAALTAGRNGRFNASGAAGEYQTYRLECIEARKADEALAKARAAVKDRRQDYLEAHRRVKIMERAEAAARAAHRAANFRIEQSELDELAGNRTRPTLIRS